MTKGFITRQIGLRIFCAMLLVLAGLGHRPMSAMAAQPAEASTYVLPDGSVATLCITDNGDSRPVKHIDRDCEACRITAGTILPLPQGDAGALLRLATVEPFVARHAQFHRLNFPPNAPPRGPPLVPDFI